MPRFHVPPHTVMSCASVEAIGEASQCCGGGAAIEDGGSSSSERLSLVASRAVDASVPMAASEAPLQVRRTRRPHGGSLLRRWLRTLP